MKPYGGCIGFTDDFSFRHQRCLRRLQATALTLLLFGLSIGVSSAQVAPTSKVHDHVYLLRGAFNVFSFGLDQIEAKLQRQGVNTTLFGLAAARRKGRSGVQEWVRADNNFSRPLLRCGGSDEYGHTPEPTRRPRQIGDRP